MVDPQPLLMTRSLSADVARAVLDMHEAAGVRCLMGVGCPECQGGYTAGW
ncbi:hypothetical protein OH809_39240 [Streptomyces sp. NBC_00873]|nr:hypothetical protein OH809_39240 [Streptomyces sp. NBC_00873]WTA41993.1 hypothetical protein OH821_04455 [Streptomyces sp. NBC_00842]